MVYKPNFKAIYFVLREKVKQSDALDKIPWREEGIPFGHSFIWINSVFEATFSVLNLACDKPFSYLEAILLLYLIYPTGGIQVVTTVTVALLTSPWRLYCSTLCWLLFLRELSVPECRKQESSTFAFCHFAICLPWKIFAHKLHATHFLRQSK